MQDWYEDFVHELFNNPDSAKIELFELLIEKEFVNKKFLQMQDWYKEAVHNLFKYPNSCKIEFCRFLIYQQLVDKEFLQVQYWYKEAAYEWAIDPDSDNRKLLEELFMINNQLGKQKFIQTLQGSSRYKNVKCQIFPFPNYGKIVLLKLLIDRKCIDKELMEKKFIKEFIQMQDWYKGAVFNLFKYPNSYKVEFCKLLIKKKWLDKEFLQVQDWYKYAVHNLFRYPFKYPDAAKIELFKLLIEEEFVDQEFLQSQNWYKNAVYECVYEWFIDPKYDNRKLLKELFMINGQFEKQKFIQILQGSSGYKNAECKIFPFPNDSRIALLKLLIEKKWIDKELIEKEFLQGQDWYKDAVHNLFNGHYSFTKSALFKLLIDAKWLDKEFLKGQDWYKDAVHNLFFKCYNNKTDCDNIEFFKLLIDKNCIDQEFCSVNPNIIYQIFIYQGLDMLKLFQELENIQIIHPGFTTTIDEKGVKLLVSLLQSPLPDVCKRLIFNMCIQENLLTERFFTIFNSLSSEFSYKSIIDFVQYIKENKSLLPCDPNYISCFLEKYKTESIEILTREDKNTIKQELHSVFDHYSSPQNKIIDTGTKWINHMKSASISQNGSFKGICPNIALYSIVNLEIDSIIDILECVQQHKISLEEINRIFTSSNPENSSLNKHYTTLKAWREKFLTGTYAPEHEILYEKFKKLVLDLEIFTSAEVEEIITNNSLEVEISGSEAAQEG